MSQSSMLPPSRSYCGRLVGGVAEVRRREQGSSVPSPVVRRQDRGEEDPHLFGAAAPSGRRRHWAPRPVHPSADSSEGRCGSAPRFFSGDETFQRIATEQVDLLFNKLHVRNIGAAHRPLLLFFREPVRGNASDATDPFWSHYNPALHSIQVTRRPDPVDYEDLFFRASTTRRTREVGETRVRSSSWCSHSILDAMSRRVSSTGLTAVARARRLCLPDVRPRRS